MCQRALYYSDQFVLSKDNFDTTRKASWIAASLDKDPIPGVWLCSPKAVHESLMSGLRKDLNEEQVAALLNKYTVGKVAFTMGGYRGIVANMTPAEEKFILDQLRQAREEAVDYKNMKEIFTIFKIHKPQIEQHLNENGRDWKKLYQDYVAAIQRGKAAPSGTNDPAADQ